MGTPYTFPSDQQRLARILKLDRYQFASSSLLYTLMQSQQDYDTQWGVDTVAMTRTDMAEYETLATEYLSAQGQQGKSSVSVAGEYSVSYTNTVQSTYAPRLSEISARIRKYVDPHNYLKNLGGARPRVT
jgi:hypothetical protein